MIHLTDDARRRFDEYLQRTRSALRGTRSVEADEVEQNVIEHVELALAGVPAPVGAEPLRQVLEQLGPPERWLPDEELPAWRRVMGRVMTGPEDWRLAYLSFGASVVMILFFPVGGILVLPIAFLLSRAYVQLLQERGEPLGARAWLVLPPIVFTFVLFLGSALVLSAVGPGLLASEKGLEALGFQPFDRIERMRMTIGVVGLASGTAWIALSGLFAWLLPPMKVLFAPILNKVKRSHLLVMTGIGLFAAAAGAALLWAI